MSLNTRQPNTLLSKFGKYADNLIMYRIAFSIPPPRASSGYQISGQISSWPDIQSKPDIQPDFFVNIQLLKYTNLVTFLYHHHILSCYSLFFFIARNRNRNLLFEYLIYPVYPAPNIRPAGYQICYPAGYRILKKSGYPAGYPMHPY